MRKALPYFLEDAEIALTCEFRVLLEGLRQDLHALDERVKTLDKRIQQQADSHPSAKRLQKIPGIGPLTATALIGAVGEW